MDMLTSDRIAAERLADWRKLAQGLHARFLVADFGAAARFVASIGEACDDTGHHPAVVIGSGHVDLELVTADAIYRDGEGTEHVVEWVTQQDIDLARRISEVAADHGLTPDPGAVAEFELGLDAVDSATIAPVWAALMAGDARAQGRGTPSDEVRDATRRVPNLWFDDHDGAETGQRFHPEVYVAPEAAEQRIAAAVAAGGTVVDDSEAPGLVVIADQEGNRGIVCVAQPPAPEE